MVPWRWCAFSILILVGFPESCRMNEDKLLEAKCCPGKGNYGIYNPIKREVKCQGKNASSPTLDCKDNLEVHMSNSSDFDSIYISASYCRDDFRVEQGDNENTREAYLFCDSSKSDQNLTKKTILVPKCCRLEEAFDPVKKICVSHPFNWTLPKLHSKTGEPWNLSRYEYLIHIDDLASNSCSKKYLSPGKDPRQHYEVQETGYLHVPAMNITYPNGEFCLDHALLPNGSWIQIALTCDQEEKRIRQECKNRVCVQKCCPLGEYFDTSEGRPRCIPGGKVWDHKDLFGSHYENLSLAENEVHGITSYPKCPGISGKGHLLQPTEYPLDDFSLTPSGALRIERNGVSIQVPQYCVDDAGNSGDDMHLVALICLMENWHEESWHEESETLYIIKITLIFLLAFFLLLTFLLYLALPESKGVHGVTLLSYVGCLLVATISLIIGQIGAPNGISNALCLASGIA